MSQKTQFAHAFSCDVRLLNSYGADHLTALFDSNQRTFRDRFLPNFVCERTTIEVDIATCGSISDRAKASRDALSTTCARMVVMTAMLQRITSLGALRPGMDDGAATRSAR